MKLRSVLTLWKILGEHRLDVGRLSVPQLGKLLRIRDRRIGVQVVCGEAEADVEVAIAKDRLALAKELLGEHGVEGVDALGALNAGAADGDADGREGIGGPCETSVSWSQRVDLHRAPTSVVGHVHGWDVADEGRVENR